MTQKIPKLLTIAGSDPSGGAGIQADLKTFSALGCYGMSVITALTAQNTQGVQGIQAVPVEFLALQLTSIFDDVMPDAVKIGMVGNAQNTKLLVEIIKKYKPKNIVLDPVMVSTSGDDLIDKNAVEILKTELIPLVDLITPNKEEAFMLGCETSKDLAKLGSKASLLTGGDTKEPTCVDVLASSMGAKAFEGRRIRTRNTHGTGCTLSSAIAANLAKGLSMQKAVVEAKNYITKALEHADALGLTSEEKGGSGPVHHFYDLWKEPEEDLWDDSV